MKRLTIKRTFQAPINEVWNALTDQSLLKQWWSPEGMTCSHISVDLKKDGLFLYCFHSQDGAEYWGRGIYTLIQEPSQLSYMDTFSDSEGEPVPPSQLGMPGDEIIESRIDITLAAVDGQTELVITMDNPYGEPLTASLTEGWNGMFDKLDLLLNK